MKIMMLILENFQNRFEDIIAHFVRNALWIWTIIVLGSIIALEWTIIDGFCFLSFGHGWEHFSWIFKYIYSAMNQVITDDIMWCQCWLEL